MSWKIKIINNTSRELPEELADAIMDVDGTLTKINDVAAEYNIKVKEYERILNGDNIKEETFILSDSFSN